MLFNRLQISVICGTGADVNVMSMDAMKAIKTHYSQLKFVPEVLSFKPAGPEILTTEGYVLVDILHQGNNTLHRALPVLYADQADPTLSPLVAVTVNVFRPRGVPLYE
ncbi:hypothetical protein NEAUS04_0114 [Nematocida ausubeli]|nr:hypothetical protein NEAUS06_1518 [Nematocida ausubeli]KAI5137969.1 hypothetical protein NEAUS07_2180 [Nematocida ausubeli]KAI5150774.1 hypothetical protein NEAUS05_2292 [Nematocida ausubeli]KAI5160740.1 hypothetical protein NEAUS04_0114 [Nematocida ausubeli]